MSTTQSSSQADQAADEGSGLVRGMGPIDAAMIVVGSMIGSGIFITSAESARLVGSPGLLLLAWVLAGVLTMTGALCCAEVASMLPKAGGQYVFLREAYGPMLGFLFGWTLFAVVQTGTIAAVSVAFAKFLGVLVPWISGDNYLVGPIRLGGSYAVSLSTTQLVGIAVIVLLTWLNTRGLKLGTLIQNSFTFTKTAALFGLIVVGLSLGQRRDAAAWTSHWWNPWANGWTPEGAQTGLGVTGIAALGLLLGRAMIGPLFSQASWNNVTFTGGEIRDPGKSLPRALLLGCGTVVSLYLMANIAYVLSLPLEGIQNAPQDRVGTAAMKVALGNVGEVLMALFIMISTFGCVNGLILAGARVYYAMAQDGLFFQQAGTLNRAHVPQTALVAQGIWSAVLTLPLTVTTAADGKVQYGNVYSQLLEYITPADLAFYMLLVGAVVLLRIQRPDEHRPFRTPLYPLPAIIYLGLAGLLILDLLYLLPDTSGMGFLIVLLGIPVYLVWSRLGRRPAV